MTNPRQWAYLSLWLVLLAVGILVIIFKLNIQSDLTGFLSTGKSSLSESLAQELKGGATSRMILLSISGGTADQRANTSKSLTQSLSGVKNIKRVSNGMSNDAKELLNMVVKYRYLLSKDAHRNIANVDNLKQALDVRLEEMLSPVGALTKEYLARDPTGEMLSILAQYESRLAIAKYHDVWISRDGTIALLVVETNLSGFALEDQQQIIDTIKDNFKSLSNNSDANSPLRLHMTGPAVFAVAARETISKESTVLSVLAGTLTLLMVYWAYRSWTLVLVSFLPLVSGLVAAVVVVTIIYGSVHGIALAFGLTLIGIAIDYPIHVYSHLNKTQSATEAVATIWPTMRLCVISTVIGFAMMATSDIQGLSQLGVIIVVGLMVAAMVTRFVIPIILSRYRILQTRQLNKDMAFGPSPNVVLVFNAALATTLIGMLIWVAKPKWEQDIAALSPISAEQRNLDKHLRAQLGAPEVAHLIFLEANELEMVLQQMEDLESTLDDLRVRKVLTHFDMPSIYLPSRKKQLERRDQLPDANELTSRIAHATQGGMFKASYFLPFIKEIAESKSFAPLEFAQVKDSVLGSRISGMLSQIGSGWRGVVLVSGLQSPTILRETLDAIKMPGLKYLDLKQETQSILTEFRDTALLRFALGSIMIVLVITLGLKSFTIAIRMTSIVTLAVSLDVMILTLLGVQFTLFHLVALLLVVGLGVDYCLFFDRKQTSNEERAMTAHGVLVCMLSTVLVYGILAFSSIPVLRAIGLTTAVGIVLVYLLCYAESPRLVKIR